MLSHLISFICEHPDSTLRSLVSQVYYLTTVCCYGNSSKHLQCFGYTPHMYLGEKGCIQGSKL